MKREKRQLILPAMLDAHFDLLRYAFDSSTLEAVVLSNTEGVVQCGLSYAHNDLCYPGVLIIGQLIMAVQNGMVQPQNSVFLIPQAGDACRGSNYLHLIRKALQQANIEIPVISLNFMEKDTAQFSITPKMLWKAFGAVFYGDLLLLLRNQTTPYEIHVGETDVLYQTWVKRLQLDFQQGKHLGMCQMRKNMAEIARSFAEIPKENRNCKKVGIVGELYIKYCGLGNHQLVQYLLKRGAEPVINGFSWYVLYYVQTHLTETDMVHPLLALAYRGAGAWISKMQRYMVQTIRNHGFACMDAFPDFYTTAKQHLSCRCAVGDGWLIGAEICHDAKSGVSRVACVQPFGCMPNQVCGKGIYASLQRQLPLVRLVSIDYDASDSRSTIENRLELLLG